jgi:ribonuclease HI
VRRRTRLASHLIQTVPAGTIDDPAPGPIGVVLRDPDGHLIAEISQRIGPAINTVAEYRALIEGLRLARGRKIQRIRVFLDSELVVEQVNGRAKVGKEHSEPCIRKRAPCSSSFPASESRGCPESGMPKRTCNQSASSSLSQRNTPSPPLRLQVTTAQRRSTHRATKLRETD